MTDKLLTAIDTLRYENAQYHTANYKVQEEQARHAEETAKTIGELLAEFKGSRLDAEEARRDAGSGSSSAPAAGDTEPDNRDEFEFEWKGILAIVGGIGAAVAGFVTGFVSRWASLFKNLGKLITTRISKILPQTSFNFFGKIGKEITNVFKNLRLAFEGGLRGVRPLLRNVNGTFKAMNRLELFFALIGAGVTKAVNTVKSLGVRIAETFKSLTASVKRFFDFGEDTNKVLKSFFKPIVNFFKSFMGVTESVGTFGKLFAKLGTVFSAFVQVGKRLFIPIQVVMGIFDAFKGATAGMERQVGTVDKIIGGVFGAITGVLKGLIAMPLDLLKDGISWIAGKLGFENFSKMLDSFSFSDMFQMVGDRIADGFVKFFQGLTYWFTNMKDRLMKPFEEGFSFGAVINLITSLPATIMGGIMDYAKNALSSLLSIFGAEDASKALDSFKFTDLLDNIIGRIGFFFSDMFGGISSSFMNIFQGDGPLLERIGAFAKNLVTSLYTWPLDLLKNVASSILGFFGMDDAAQALDSFSFKDTFGKIIDWVIALPGKLVDGLMAIFRGEVSVGDLLSEAMTGAMDMASQFNEWLKGIIRQPLSDLVKDDSLINRGIKALIPASVFDWAGVDKGTGDITAPKVSAPQTTPRTDNGNRVAEMSRQNEQAKNSGSTVVVSAPTQTNQTNVNNNTAAVIDQNLPTVDYNDRSFGNNLTWQGGVGLV